MPFTEEESIAIERHFARLRESKTIPTFNVSFCGAPNAGKASILSRLRLGVYDPQYCFTGVGTYGDPDRILFTHRGKAVMVICELVVIHYPYPDDGIRMSTREREIRDADAYVLVYDVSDRASFAVVVGLHKMIRRLQTPTRARDEEPRPKNSGPPVLVFPSPRPESPPLPPMLKMITVVASKGDLPKKDWAVKPHEGKRFSEQIGAEFVQLSAKTGVGLEKMPSFGVIVDNIVLARMRKEGDLEIPQARPVGFAKALIRTFRRWFGSR